MAKVSSRTAIKDHTWKKIRNRLMEALVENRKQRRLTAPGSSANRKAQKNIEDILGKFDDHADNALKQINSAVGAGVLAGISAQADAAKREGDRIARITADINRVTTWVNQVKSLVVQFGAIVA